MYPLKPEYPYTMPTGSVFRDPRPWEQGGMRYGRNTALTVTFLTSEEGAAALLPEPFHLGDEALVSVSIVQCEDVDWLAGRAYNLIGVDVAAVFAGEEKVLAVVPGGQTAFKEAGACVCVGQHVTDQILDLLSTALGKPLLALLAFHFRDACFERGHFGLQVRRRFDRLCHGRARRQTNGKCQ